ncbi:hypothetical protein FRB95_001138 [Tulasnella sp. JGI-2019a]|nr:hypothetical protein FRB95_001138 [Tulasnella sp. JGI-2019a]
MRLADHAAYTPVTTSDTLTSILLDIPRPLKRPRIMAARLKLDQKNLDAELASLDPKLRVKRSNIIEDREVIGIGGYGVVTRGLLTAEGISLHGNLNDGKVAVKKLPVDPSKDLRVAIRLIREVKIWAQLDHPNILKFLGFYLSPNLDEILIISPWEPRGNINKYIMDTKPDMPKRLRMLSDVAEGLAYLHAFKPTVCHGDIKGDNVLVNGSDRALLCDYGLEKVEGVQEGLTTSHGFKRSMRWCSPELFEDRPKTTASDMWAFGCLVVEVIYESIPYSHVHNNSAVIVRIVRGELPAQSKNLRQESSIDLWDLLDECWQSEPANRLSAEKCVNSLRLAREEKTVIGSAMNQSAQPYLGSLPPNETGVGDEGSSLPAHVLTQETQQPPLSTAGPESLPLNQKGRPGRPGPPTQEERETQQVLNSSQQPLELLPHISPPAQPRSESPPANQEGHGGDKEPIQSADALTEQTQQPPPPSMTGPASLPLDQKGDRPDEGPGRSGYPPTRQERETQQLQSESPSADREGHGGDERPIQPAGALMQQEDENEDSWFCTSDLPVGQTSVEGYYLSPPGQPVSKGQLLSQGMSQADPVDTTPLKLDDRRCCSWC